MNAQAHLHLSRCHQFGLIDHLSWWQKAKTAKNCFHIIPNESLGGGGGGVWQMAKYQLVDANATVALTEI